MFNNILNSNNFIKILTDNIIYDKRNIPRSTNNILNHVDNCNNITYYKHNNIYHNICHIVQDEDDHIIIYYPIPKKPIININIVNTILNQNNLVNYKICNCDMNNYNFSSE